MSSTYDIFDHLQNPVIVVSHEGDILYFNFVCSTYFKLPPRKITAFKNISELLVVANFDLLEGVQKSLKSDGPYVSPELALNLAESINTAVFKFIPLNNQVIIHLQDFSIEKHLHEKYKQQIIELKSTHDQIVKSDKLTALGEMIAGISHEISSPLTVAGDSLLALSNSLDEKNFVDATIQLSDLAEEFHRIKQIISNMQGLTRNREDVLTVINLSDVIKDSIDFVKGLGVLKDIKLDLQIDQTLILANAGKLQQVLINLIKNAADAMSFVEEKKLSIHILADDFTVNINVTDTGVGIKDPEKAFEMFYTTKESGEGTGLGLAISQKVMNTFHGNITILPSDIGAKINLSLPKLDVETFTTTNRYLSGGRDTEDPKLIVFSDNVVELGQIYDHFSGDNIVLILTDNPLAFQDLCDSYMVDASMSFSESVKSPDSIFRDFSGKSFDEVKKYIGEVKNG